MELLAKYCTQEQKDKWLMPLMNGTMTSSYSMTEPEVASSDATNINISMKREGDYWITNGRKIYGTVLKNPELSFYIMMGCTDPDNKDPWKRHSMFIVPRDTPGVTHERNMTIMGYDHAPAGHAEILYKDAKIPAANIIWGEGRAFEIAQGRLGPGRIHHWYVPILHASQTSLI
jgi:acyl-CoA dehydrogenase